MTFWTAERDDELRRLHAQGLAFVAIGAALGCSKNACIGRAHRLGLPPRPHIITRHANQYAGLPEDHAAKRAEALEAVKRGATYEKAAAIAGVHPSTLQSHASRHGLRQPREVRLIAPAEPAPMPAKPTAPPWQRRGCCWPMWGDKEAPTHRYCDKPRTTAKGKVSPWCAKHHRRAWQAKGG